MCFIELVDYNEAAMPEKAAKKTATRRSRRSPKKAVAEAAAKADKELPAAEEAPKAE